MNTDMYENKKMDQHMRAQELAEESFDDIEIDGYLDYEEETASEEDDHDIEYVEDIDIDDTVNEETVAADKDWVNNGLNKKYEGKFDLKKAKELFNTVYPDLEKNQIESIRYATFFARHGNNEAKNYIVSIIQHPETCASTGKDSVYDLAQTSLYLFFRNYVRKCIETFYAKQIISNSSRYEKLKEAPNACFVAILANINSYDSEKGQLTTFFKNHILGALNEYEAESRSRQSKQTLAIDSKVSRTQTNMLNKGVVPNTRLVALESNLSVNQVIISQTRIKAENTSISADSEDGRYAAGKVKQTIFESPEKAFLENEEKNELRDMLEILSETERSVLLAVNGLEQIGNTFVEAEHDEDDSLIKIARYLGIKSNDVKTIYNEAIQKLRAANGIENSKDHLLSGRSITFAKDKRDDAVEEYIDDFADIFDVPKYDSKKTYKKDEYVSFNNQFYMSLIDENDKDITNTRAWLNISEKENELSC